MSISYSNISREYNQLQNGSGKLAAIQRAINIADEEKDYTCALMFRYDYIKESIFYDAYFKAFIIFPEYLKIYDEHKDCEFLAKDILWTYKWILGHVNNFYQISKNDIFKYFDDFKKRCLENGYSLRTYYYKLKTYLEISDIEKYKKIALEYLKYPRDSICDCETCEKGFQVYYELNYGSFKKATKLAEPILNGTETCFDFPQFTYEEFLIYYIDRNDIENSSKYEKLLINSIRKNCINEISTVGTLLRYYAISHNINKGIKLFKNNLKFYFLTKDQLSKFSFGLEACTFFKSIIDKREIIKILLDKSIPIYKEDGIYKINELIEFFKNDIYNIGIKFDKRNESNHYINKIKKNFSIQEGE